jgi:dienelactone hydrolase
MDDVRLVLSTVGSERAAFFGCHTGGRMALLLAATHPDEVSAAVTFGSHPATLRDDYPVDIRGLLGSIQAPVLVLHRTGDRLANVNASRYMAERIPGARLVELPGEDHFPFFGDQDAVVELTQEFLTGARPTVDPDRVLATVLFTDIVDSTRLAAELGDRRWHRLLVGHQEVVRAQLARFQGREVKTTGAGFAFADRSTHRLKGVPDAWQLHAVEPAAR